MFTKKTGNNPIKQKHVQKTSAVSGEKHARQNTVYRCPQKTGKSDIWEQLKFHQHPILRGNWGGQTISCKKGGGGGDAEHEKKKKNCEELTTRHLIHQKLGEILSIEIVIGSVS